MDLETVCKKYNFSEPRRFKGGLERNWTGTVLDQKGRLRFLKISNKKWAKREEKALNIWHPLTPKCKALEPGVLLMDYVPMPSVFETGNLDAGAAFVAGRLIRQIHDSKNPAAGKIKRALSEHVTKDHRRHSRPPRNSLNSSQLALHQLYLQRVIKTNQKEEPVLLHGDFWPSNLLLEKDGLSLIDPKPCWGMRAWDLAHFASLSRNPIHSLENIIAGYQDHPNGLGRAFAYCALRAYNFSLYQPSEVAHLKDDLEEIVNRLTEGQKPKFFIDKDNIERIRFIRSSD
jgi:hypothetical protein